MSIGSKQVWKATNDGLVMPGDQSSIPYALDTDEAVAPCLRWSAQDITVVNQMIKDGNWTLAAAINYVALTAKRVPIVVTPGHKPFQGKVMRFGNLPDDDFQARQTGEGTDGITYPLKNRKHTALQRARQEQTPEQLRAQRVLLGTTATGVQILPRRHTVCKRGHVVAGDNVYVTPAGHQQCVICRKEGRERYNAK